jgi:hypothetical protein
VLLVRPSSAVASRLPSAASAHPKMSAAVRTGGASVDYRCSASIGFWPAVSFPSGPARS